MLVVRLPRWVALLGLAALASAAGCSDVGYNPYVQNDGHRPVGKAIEDVQESLGNAVDAADARFENLFY